MGAEVITQEGKGEGRAIAQALEYIDSDMRYVVFVDAGCEMIEVLDDNPVGMVRRRRKDDVAFCG